MAAALLSFDWRPVHILRTSMTTWPFSPNVSLGSVGLGYDIWVGSLFHSCMDFKSVTTTHDKTRPRTFNLSSHGLLFFGGRILREARIHLGFTAPNTGSCRLQIQFF